MVIMVGLLPSISWAQASATKDKAGAADLAWQSAVAKAAPSVAVARNSAPPTAADAQAAVEQYAADQKSAAQSAKEFYIAYPTDPRVPAAKKLEAASLLKAVSPAAADRDQAAFRVATAFVVDKTHDAKDRFEVAALLIEQQFKVQRNGRTLADEPVAQEKAADALYAEFGAIPSSFDYYLRAIDHVDPETSSRLARKVAVSSASAAQKKQAQVALDRFALIGKPLPLALKDVDGKAVNLASPGKYTVLYLWSASHAAADWAALTRAKENAPSNTEWVGLALDTTAVGLAGARSKAPAQMTHCLLNLQQRAAAVSTLKARRLPYVYVLERNGAVAGYGRPTDLPALLARLGR